LIPLKAGSPNARDDALEGGQEPLPENAIMCRGLKSALLSLLPSLRAYALCLTPDRWEADELVHSSLIEIWTRHQGERGLALKVAAFSVLRGQFLRQGMVDLILPSPGKRQPSREDHDFQIRFMRLPRTAREALSLIEVWRCARAQAAELRGCVQETICRRVAIAYLDRPRPFPFELVGIKGAAA
jgi:RNA polymerase sigma-70 factor (ECF subfamily)